MVGNGSGRNRSITNSRNGMTHDYQRHLETPRVDRIENDEDALGNTVAELARELLANRHGPGSGCTIEHCYPCEQATLPTRVQGLPNKQ